MANFIFGDLLRIVHRFFFYFFVLIYRVYILFLPNCALAPPFNTQHHNLLLDSFKLDLEPMSLGTSQIRINQSHVSVVVDRRGEIGVNTSDIVLHRL